MFAIVDFFAWIYAVFGVTPGCTYTLSNGDEAVSFCLPD